MGRMGKWADRLKPDMSRVEAAREKNAAEKAAQQSARADRTDRIKATRDERLAANTERTDAARERYEATKAEGREKRAAAREGRTLGGLGRRKDT